VIGDGVGSCLEQSGAKAGAVPFGSRGSTLRRRERRYVQEPRLVRET
jgi:hypothetical protein